MPNYGKRSRKQLGTCHRDLQTIFSAILPYIDHSIIEGTRDEETQNRYFNEGKSKIKYPNGKHNSTPSMAVDVVPYPEGYGDVKKMILLAGYVMCITEQLYREGKIEHKIRWGGDWDSDKDLKDQTFNDYPHYELYYV